MPIHAPFWGVFGAHFPQMMSLIVLTPKRSILGRNHVIWAINRENRSRGSSWACEREKRTGQDKKKVTKELHFTYLWRSPHWSDVHENLCSWWCSRRNLVCQVSKWNFYGLRFYRGSNFPFFLLILNGPYNSAALLRCLWLMNRLIPTELLMLLESWLSSCYGCVKWVNVWSCMFSLEFGVRQGSVLSPFCFLLMWTT